MDELRYQVDLLSAMNQKLENEERMYRLLCATSTSAFLYVNLLDGYIRTLGSWEQFFPEIQIRDVNDFTKLYSRVEDKYVLPFRKLLYLEDSKENSGSDILKLTDGSTWVECEVNVIYDYTQMPTDKIIRFKNISKLKNQNDELTYMAYYDVMTGLYNRNYFVRLLADFVRRAEEENTVVSVMFIDVDDFSKINDGFGLAVGDEVVQQFGQFLQEFSSEHVLVSHFNADLYCIGIFEPMGKYSVEKIYQAVRERTKLPFRLSNGQDVDISVSVGVAEFPEAAQNTLELINCAEIVMFKAKKRGKDSMQYFDASILKDFLHNVAIETKLKEAVFAQNFTMNFQPQYFTENGKLRGMEALIRWRDNDGRMISPAVFIPIAEKNGTIVPIGAWVVDESIRIFSQWKKDYRIPMILSLNISAIQYNRDDFVDMILNCLKKYDLDPNFLELEITESVFIENFHDVTEKLRLLREYGIKVSLDDFGTGYSSLSYLKKLPIDTLKIDKSFIDTITMDENTRVIADSVVNMAKRLGYETIAEGVEDQDQFNYLKKIGCDCIQGFFLGRPSTSEEIERLLLQIEESER